MSGMTPKTRAIAISVPIALVVAAALAVLIWWLVTQEKQKPAPVPKPPLKPGSHAWGVVPWNATKKKPPDTVTGPSNGRARPARLLAAAATPHFAAGNCAAPSPPNPAMAAACAAGQFQGVSAACKGQSKGTNICATYGCYEQQADGSWRSGTGCASTNEVLDLTDATKPVVDKGLTGADLAAMAGPGNLLYCACPGDAPPPAPLPDCAATMNTDNSLAVHGYDLSAHAPADNFAKMNAVLGVGNIYGDAFAVQCSTTTMATANSKTVSSYFCAPDGKSNVPQVQACPSTLNTQTAAACQGDASCSKCGDVFGPVGTKLNLTVDADFGYQSHSFDNVDPAQPCTGGTAYRGLCIPDTMNGKPVAVDSAVTDDHRPFKIALYHGGKAGLPEISAKCTAAYLYEVAQFVAARKIDRVFLSVDSPLPYVNGDTPQQNSYFLQPQFIAANFLALLPEGTECGLIAYASPTDSGWNFQSCTPYADTDAYGQAVRQTCDAQWCDMPDLFPLHCKDGTEPGCANCRATECYGNPYAKQLLGGDIGGAQDSCGKFPFVQLQSSANKCVTPCEGSANCFDTLQTVACGGDQKTADAVCTDFVAGHCVPYNTRGTASCAIKAGSTTGTCTMCVPPDAVDAFASCANCANCCPQAAAPKTDVPACAASVGGTGNKSDLLRSAYGDATGPYGAHYDAAKHKAELDAYVGTGDRLSGSDEMVHAYKRQFVKAENLPNDVYMSLPKADGGKMEATSCGCPNIMSQIVAYMTAVNDAMDRLVAAKLDRTIHKNKLTMLVMDGEDAHMNNKQGGQCQFVEMVKQLAPDTTVYMQSLGKPAAPAHAHHVAGAPSKTRMAAAATFDAYGRIVGGGGGGDGSCAAPAPDTCSSAAPAPACLTSTTGESLANAPTWMGHAYSMATAPYKWVVDPAAGAAHVPTSVTNSMAMPEMYWFMGVLFPCVGSSNQIAKTDSWKYSFPEVCTSKTAYNDAINVAKLDVVKFYMWIKLMQKCAPGGGSFGAMQQNMIDYKDRVWPMISCEGLSAGKPDAPESEWCLARKANKDGAVQASICGTADMAYVWDDWDTVLQFMNAIYKDCYLNEWGMYKEAAPADTPCIALYEIQFIRPSWMPNKTFNAPNGPPADPKDWAPGSQSAGLGLQACMGSCADLAFACDSTVKDSDQYLVSVKGSCAQAACANGRGDCVNGLQMQCKPPKTGAGPGSCLYQTKDPPTGVPKQTCPPAASSAQDTPPDRVRAAQLQRSGRFRASLPVYMAALPTARSRPYASQPVPNMTRMAAISRKHQQEMYRPSGTPAERNDYAWNVLRKANGGGSNGGGGGGGGSDDGCGAGGCAAECKPDPVTGKGCCCYSAPECTTDDQCCGLYGLGAGCKDTCCQMHNGKGVCSVSDAMKPCTTGDACGDGEEGNCCPGVGNKCVPNVSSYLCGRPNGFDAYDDAPACGSGPGPGPSGDCPAGGTCTCKYLYGAGNDQCKTCSKGTDCTQTGDTCIPCSKTNPPKFPACNATCGL